MAEIDADRQFGAAVRRARQSLGWSQEVMAEKLAEEGGVSVGGQSGVARIESGARPTRLSEAARIARYLSFDLPNFAIDPLQVEIQVTERRLREAEQEADRLRSRLEQLRIDAGGES